MTLTRNQWLAMQLAGTVSIPPTLPDVVRISLVRAEDMPASARHVTQELVLTEQAISARVTIRRFFPAEEVMALQTFPGEPAGDLRQGTWCLGPEITRGPVADQLRAEGVWGIAYVREEAPAFMQVDVGMTAAESAEYYPPLPGDRSQDHYQFGSVHVAPTSDGCCGGPPCSARRVPTTLSSHRWAEELPGQTSSPLGTQPVAESRPAVPVVPTVVASASSSDANGHSAAPLEEVRAS